MATIKSYTDINQSKKLAEILPLESADMYYWCADHYPKEDWIIEVGTPDDNYECICAWSLAALLSILTENKICHYNDRYYCQYINEGGEFSIYSTAAYDNPVDACVAMIEKLNELKLL